MMPHYEFTPQAGKKKTKYVGSRTDEPSRTIPLPYDTASLRQVLEWGATPEESPYTHQEVAHWCGRMFMAYLDVDCDAQLEKAVDIAADVDCQWTLFLANKYSLPELQKLDFSKVRLPVDWFTDWKSTLG